jgi:nitrite reductase/ring-hydroxylating ferredoxin subunit
VSTQEVLVARGYVKVARTDELPPGACKRVQRDGEPVLLVNVDGEYYAVSDTCPHEDASLYKGYMKGPYAHCPLHGSRFDVRTGKVETDPAEDDLTVYPVRVEGGDLLLGEPAGR